MSSYEKISAVNSSERLDIIVTIVSKGKGEGVVDIARESGALVNIICHGRGTAPSSILEMLGLGATEKEVVLSFTKDEKSEELLEKISKGLEFAKPGHGIAFTVPLQSVAGIMAFKFLTTDSLEDD
ncbi:MAG: P-II family nitrogen regulator [Oscillospiraceae bacterium]|nr:P-II family nitrogen regulator [Oscillospiraceae bacterium]